MNPAPPVTTTRTALLILVPAGLPTRSTPGSLLASCLCSRGPNAACIPPAVSHATRPADASASRLARSRSWSHVQSCRARLDVRPAAGTGPGRGQPRRLRAADRGDPHDPVAESRRPPIRAAVLDRAGLRAHVRRRHAVVGQPVRASGARPTPTSDLGVEDAQLGPGAGADGGFTPAMRNPPLYYLYETIPYAVASGGSIFDRVFAMRARQHAGAARRRRVHVADRRRAVRPAAVAPGARDAGRRAPAAARAHDRGRQSRRVPGRALDGGAVRDDDRRQARAEPRPARVAVRARRRRPASRSRAGWRSCFRWPRLAALVAWRRVRGGRAGSVPWRSPPALRVALAGLAALVYYAVRARRRLDRVRQFGSYVWQFYLPRLGFMDTVDLARYGVGRAVRPLRRRLRDAGGRRSRTGVLRAR